MSLRLCRLSQRTNSLWENLRKLYAGISFYFEFHGIKLKKPKFTEASVSSWSDGMSPSKELNGNLSYFDHAQSYL